MMEVNGKWTQFGIVSFGDKCSVSGFPGVYVYTGNYYDWIQANIKY